MVKLFLNKSDMTLKSRGDINSTRTICVKINRLATAHERIPDTSRFLYDENLEFLICTLRCVTVTGMHLADFHSNESIETTRLLKGELR